MSKVEKKNNTKCYEKYFVWIDASQGEITIYELHDFLTNYSVFINIQLWRWHKNYKFFFLDCLHFLLETSEKSLYCVVYLCIVHIWSTTAILTQILVLCMRSVMHKWLLLPSGYLSINIPNKIGSIKVILMKKNNIQIIQSHIIDKKPSLFKDSWLSLKRLTTIVDVMTKNSYSLDHILKRKF